MTVVKCFCSQDHLKVWLDDIGWTTLDQALGWRPGLKSDVKFVTGQSLFVMLG